eukprot:TRINITY_DN3219_c0_g1_i1.p1 TRINITY_DN3219_c0_g1~~TRINITY_DN3219_c0_g1_i1.p1  ORF type:complete len:323 (+),score=77.22 TRINITY_DN3219_c0_g1_i1:128-1096(+)
MIRRPPRSTLSSSSAASDVYKRQDQQQQYVNYTSNFTQLDEILEFCHLNSLAPVNYFTEDTSYRIFAGPVKTQMVFFINETENNSEIIKEFEEAAKYNIEEELFYERMIYTIITSSPENQEMLDFFGIDTLNYPALFISTIHKDQLAKYLYNQDDPITKENILQFTTQFRLLNLTRNYLTEQLPEPTNKTLKKLVGKNFEQEVYRNHENYLVLFCAEIEKEQCSEHLKLFKKIANKMNEKDKLIMGIGMINPIRNELARFRNQPQLGEILLYLKGKKTMPEEYTGEIEFDKIKNFIQANIPEIKFQDKEEVLSLGSSQKIEL